MINTAKPKSETTQTPEACPIKGEEKYFAMEATLGLTFSESVDELFQQYDAVRQDNGLDLESEVFLRLYLSDITNQSPLLRTTLEQRGSSSFVSVVGQPPVTGSKLALTAYHVRSTSSVRKERLAGDGLVFSHGPYKSLWLKHAPQRPGGAYEQTGQIFGHLAGVLRKHRATVQDNVVRTWIYVRDVDNNYQPMVNARRELFRLVGMDKETHFIASTGIAGCPEARSHLVSMDSLSVLGLEQNQISYINAPEYLCPTHDYNVTFERATRVVYGDRSHCYISGTASIDKYGEVVHKNDVEKQAQRTLVNIEALLNRAENQLSDLKYLVVYLRDSSDTLRISEFLASNLPKGLPYIMVQGAVCRVDWLIEMEGVAVTSKGNDNFQPFC